MPKIVDLTGQRFGRLAVIECVGVNKRHSTVWRVICDCGNEKIVPQPRLARGATRSCGCLARDTHTKHGQCGTPTYHSWADMKKRCTNPKQVRFERYGGRGISVCQHWQDFANFLSDMGNKPSRKYTIDRIDNDGHYSCGHCEECIKNKWPANCRWITKSQQGKNRSYNVFLTHDGITLCLADWAEKLGMVYGTLHYRYRAGWSTKKMLETPVKK